MRSVRPHQLDNLPKAKHPSHLTSTEYHSYQTIPHARPRRRRSASAAQGCLLLPGADADDRSAGVAAFKQPPFSTASASRACPQRRNGACKLPKCTTPSCNPSSTSFGRVGSAVIQAAKERLLAVGWSPNKALGEAVGASSTTGSGPNGGASETEHGWEWVASAVAISCGCTSGKTATGACVGAVTSRTQGDTSW